LNPRDDPPFLLHLKTESSFLQREEHRRGTIERRGFSTRVPELSALAGSSRLILSRSLLRSRLYFARESTRHTSQEASLDGDDEESGIKSGAPFPERETVPERSGNRIRAAASRSGANDSSLELHSAGCGTDLFGIARLALANSRA